MKKYFPITLLFLFLFSCQLKQHESLTHQIIGQQSDEIFEKLVEVRRDFHTNPELAGKEKRTQETIKKYLLDLGLEVKTDIYGKAVVGILNGGQEGRKIAWRAEMDASPHDFADDVAFKSKIEGVQHGCGHDIHLAIALGIAEVFSKHRSAIKGTIYFIFQPEEETFLGAKRMIDNGLLSMISPEEIYALHVTALPTGTIMVKPNELYAYQKRVQITLKNKITETESVELYEEIKSAMTRIQANSAPWNVLSAFDPNIGLSNPNTTFKDYCFMEENALIEIEDDKLYILADLYETRSSKVDRILPKIESAIKASKYKNLLHSVSFIQKNPTVQNDEALTEKSIEVLSNIYGSDLFKADYGQIPYFNDDFCYFQQKIPGVYFLLGGSNREKGIIAMNHAPNFMVDEECIRLGVRTFSSLILERLNEK